MGDGEKKVIVLPRHIFRQLVNKSKTNLPNESCALVFSFPDDSLIVDRVIFVKNISTSPRTEYLIDPFELLSIEEKQTALGLELMGIFHSHPNGKAIPSKTDLLYSVPNLYYLILKLDQNSNTTAVKCWSLANNKYSQIELSVL